MNISQFFGFSLSAILLLSCSQMRASEKVKTPPKTVQGQTNETGQMDDEELIRKKGAANHELADADADDQLIKKEIGEDEIDKDIAEADKNEIPYTREFLLKKKTKRMQFWVDYFTKNQRERFQRFINNGEEYRHHIEKIFASHGLPKELYFVGLIESGYYLGARSHAAAVGPWQFIKGTGKRYGLKISSELDERQDLFKASEAAAMYFKDLHNVFSSWELALSAYNAGEYGIIRRIMRYGTRDFYELSRNKQLPSETINYVPKVLAAMHIVQNAKTYGFHIPKKQHRLFDRTELKAVGKNTSLRSIASRLGVSLDVLKRLNPELRTNSTPRYFSGTYYLRIPKSKYNYAVALAQNPTQTSSLPITRPEKKIDLIRRIAKQDLTPKNHRVKRGETILSLSRRYNISPKAIASVNGLSTWKTKLRVGQQIKLSKSTVKLPDSLKMKRNPIVYKVRPGDNLNELAKLFDIKISKIKKVNGLKREKIMVGQKIILPDTQKGIYVVKRGDHLAKVARKLNQPIEALVKLNALKKKSIYPGQKIIVNMD